MKPTYRAFLSKLMRQAWAIYRQRHIPGAVAQTFSEALRRAWAWLIDADAREAARQAWGRGLTRVIRLAPMTVSPIARSLTAAPYGATEAARRGYLTSAMGR